MFKVFLSISSISAFFCFAEDFQKFSKPKEIELNNKFESVKSTVFSYVHIVPKYYAFGLGASYRAQIKNFAVQIDMNGGLLVGVFPYTGVSISPVVYPFACKNGVWHSGGLNMGAGLEFHTRTFGQMFVMPIFMGYQGERLFFETNVTLMPCSFYYAEYIPGLKFGFCF